MIQKKNDLLSIIIPAYNAEKYIQTTVECLLHQTYPNKEIIIVDNGSTDDTSIICDKYCKKSSFIRVIHLQKNIDVYGARNMGLQEAKGDYIAFMDADDGIDEYAYEILINMLTKTKSDVAACDFKVEYSDNFRIEKKQPSVINHYIYEGKNSVLGGVGNSKYDLSGFVWNKVFTRMCIGDTLFRTDAPICDDMIFVYNVLAHVDRAVYVDIPMYHYRYVANSLSKGEKDISKFLGCLMAMDRLYKSCVDIAPQCMESIAKTYLFWCTKTCEQMLKATNKQAFKEIQTNVKAYKTYIDKCSFRVHMLCRAILISWYVYYPLGLLIWYMKQFYITIHRRR